MPPDPADCRAVADDDFDDLLDGLEGEAREARAAPAAQACTTTAARWTSMRQAVAEDRLVLLPVERVLARRAQVHAERARRADRARPSRQLRAAPGARSACPTGPPDDDASTATRDLELAEALKAVLDAGVAARARHRAQPRHRAARSRRSPRRRGRWSPRRCSSRASTEHELGERRGGAPRASSCRGWRRRSRYAFERAPARAPALGRPQRRRHRRGPHAGRARDGRRLRRPRRLHAARRGGPGRGARRRRRPPRGVAAELRRAAGDARQDDRRRGDARLARARPARSTLALVDAADDEGEDFPQLRVGIACGPALERAGDWYGSPVNLGQPGDRPSRGPAACS